MARNAMESLWENWRRFSKYSKQMVKEMLLGLQDQVG